MRTKRVVWKALAVSLAAAMLASGTPMAAMATGGPAATGVGDAAVRPLNFGAQGLRVQGIDRFGTSVALSQRGWQTSRWVVVASARNWPDALVAGPLAAALGAPVLLTEPGSLPGEVAAEVTRLGASDAIVVGGTAAVGDAVLAGLVSAGVPSGNVERIGGKDRYATAALVADRIAKIRGEARAVVVATGERYPDALAVSGFAGASGMPVLLTRASVLPPATVRALADLDVIQTLVVGGTGAVCANVCDALPYPTRIGGTDRYDTARRIAEYAFANGFTYDTVIVAVGTSFADALCAGPYAASIGAPVVLTSGKSLSKAADEFFNSHCSSVKSILVIGGPGAIGDPVVTAIERAAVTELSPATELVTAAVSTALETVTPDGALVFAAGAPGVASIETSDVLVSGPTDNAPSGFLLRAVSVTESGGKVTVETTAATLADVIVKGSLDVTGAVDPNATGEDSSSLMMTTATASDGTHVDLQFDTAAGTVRVPTTSGPLSGGPGLLPQADMGDTAAIPFETGIDAAGEATAPAAAPVVVSGGVSLSGGFSLNASWGHLYYEQRWWGRESITGLQSLTFVTYLSETLEFNLDVNRDVAYTLNIIGQIEKRKQKTDPTYRMRFKIGSPWFWVGWVPVNVTFYVTPIAKLTLGTTGFHFGFKQTSTVTLGVGYTYSGGWSTVSGASNSFSVRGPTLDGGAATATVGATVDCLFYNTVGPYFGAQGSLGVRSDVAQNPWWSASVAVDGLYGGKLDILGKLLSFGGSVPFFRRVIVAAPGPYPTGGAVWWPRMVAGSVAGAGTGSASGGVRSVATPALDMSTVDPSDFSIDGLDVTGVAQLPDGTVRLTTGPHAPGREYVATVKNGSFRTQGGIWAMSSAGSFVGHYAPGVTAARALDGTTVDVTFETYGRSLDAASIDASDFAVGGLTVLAAALQPDACTVRLTTGAQAPGTAYTVAVAGGAVSAKEGFPGASSSAGFVGYMQPAVVSVVARAADTVDVTFTSYALLDASTIDATDFTIPGLTVSGATLQPDGRTVRVGTSAQVKGTSYTVSAGAGDIADAVGFTSAGSDAGFVGYWPPTVSGATVVDSRTVDVSFSSYYDIDSATVQTGDFTLASPSVADPVPAIVSAAVQPDGRTVRVRVASRLYPQRGHEVSVADGALADTTWDCAASSATFTAAAPSFAMANVSDGKTRPATVVRFANPSQGYVLHTWGEIAYTSDGGTTWLSRSLPGAPVSNKHVRDIAFVGGDPLKPVVVGWGGMIYSSINAGSAWTLRIGEQGSWPLPLRIDTDHLWTVDFADSSKGYIGGSGWNEFQQSTNAGATWALHSQSATIPVDGAWGIDNRWLRFAPDGLRGYYVVGDRILVTDDGGVTWSQRYSGAPGYFGSVCAPDSQNAWAVGTNGTILRTADGGVTWQPQSSGTAQALSGVVFEDAYHGFAVGANSTLLHTWDGGSTWTALAAPTTGLFDSADFADFDNAWVAGWDGGTGGRLFKMTTQW